MLTAGPRVSRDEEAGMPKSRSISWLKYFLLALPLVCLTAWLTAGGVRGSFGPDVTGGAPPAKSAPSPIISRSMPSPGPPPGDSPAPAGPVAGIPGAPAAPAPPPAAFPGHRPPSPSPQPTLAGFPPPDEDYPSERLFQRVDGAADALIAAGCGRLLVWRIADPPAEMELLIFDRAEGAAKIFSRDTGPGRDPGPGEEASVSDQSVYFRRGRFYVRILGDPDAGPARARLLELAARADRGLPPAGDKPTAGNRAGAEGGRP